MEMVKEHRVSTSSFITAHQHIQAIQCHSSWMFWRKYITMEEHRSSTFVK